MQTLYPRSEADVIRIFEVANASQLALRWANEGARTSNAGPTRGVPTARTGLRFDPNTLNQILAFDAAKRLIIVQPGVRLSQLNDSVRSDGLCLPIFLEKGPANQADPTIGHLIHLNSLSDNFLQVGRMVHYVAAIDAVMADASSVRFSTFGDGGDMVVLTAKMSYLIPQLFEVATQYRAQIAAELGAHPWRKNGYNLDIFDVSAQTMQLYNPNRSLNLAHLLVGSFGQLAFPKRITLRLVDFKIALPSALPNTALKFARGGEPTGMRSAADFESAPPFSTLLLEAFGRVKQLFDPEKRLNPVSAAFVGSLQE